MRTGGPNYSGCAAVTLVDVHIRSMGFLSRRSATAQKKPIVSDDLAAPPPELEMNMDDLWEQALARVRLYNAGTSPPILLLCPGARMLSCCHLLRSHHAVSPHARA